MPRDMSSSFLLTGCGATSRSIPEKTVIGSPAASASPAETQISDKAFAQTIEEKLERIIDPEDPEVSFSSSPGAYISHSREDYDYIVAQGGRALAYMLHQFEITEGSGLKHWIMAAACSDILDLESQGWSTGREWYNKYGKQYKAKLKSR